MFNFLCGNKQPKFAEKILQTLQNYVLFRYLMNIWKKNWIVRLENKKKTEVSKNFNEKQTIIKKEKAWSVAMSQTLKVFVFISLLKQKNKSFLERKFSRCFSSISSLFEFFFDVTINKRYMCLCLARYNSVHIHPKSKRVFVLELL